MISTGKHFLFKLAVVIAAAYIVFGVVYMVESIRSTRLTLAASYLCHEVAQPSQFIKSEGKIKDFCLRATREKDPWGNRYQYFIADKPGQYSWFASPGPNGKLEQDYTHRSEIAMSNASERECGVMVFNSRECDDLVVWLPRPANPPVLERKAPQHE